MELGQPFVPMWLDLTTVPVWEHPNFWQTFSVTVSHNASVAKPHSIENWTPTPLIPSTPSHSRPGHLQGTPQASTPTLPSMPSTPTKHLFGNPLEFQTLWQSHISSSTLTFPPTVLSHMTPTPLTTFTPTTHYGTPSHQSATPAAIPNFLRSNGRNSALSVLCLKGPHRR